MNIKQKEEIKKEIKQNIIKLENEILLLQDNLKPLVKDCSIDSIDHKALKQEQNINIYHLQEAQKRLNRLIHALPRVDKEEYGVCEECEEDIAFARLMLIPESTHCVACMNELGL